MKIVNNVKKQKPQLEVGDIICFQSYGEAEYRLVCKTLVPDTYKYFTISLSTNSVQMTSNSLEDLWFDYTENFDNDLHIIKAKNIKLVIE